MAYSKLHSSIVNSSLWVERDSTRLLFITLLAMCDKDGMVYGSRGGLSRVANIEPDEIDEAWDSLMSPDPDSSDKHRAPENEGRRVEEVSGGFKLLNFEYYRGLRNEDDRREQNRAAQAKFKSKVSHAKPPQAAASHAKPRKAHTDTDTETEEKFIVPTALVPGGDAYRPPDCPFQELLAAYHELCPSMSQVRVMTNMRMKHCRARWIQVCVEDKCGKDEAMEFFRGYFRMAQGSRFLSGRIQQGPSGKDRAWKADFEWLMTAGNFAKVVEGKYSDERNAA